jgi:hypothetical protein
LFISNTTVHTNRQISNLFPTLSAPRGAIEVLPTQNPERKDPMLLINAVRRKRGSRMLALVRDNSTFEQEYENSYAA